MAGNELGSLLDGARSNAAKFGSVLQSQRRSLSQAAEGHRARALEFFEHVVSGFDDQKQISKKSQFSARGDSAGLARIATSQSRKLRGTGVRLVSTAPAADKPSSEKPAPPPSTSAGGDADFQPTLAQLLARPAALLHFVPKDASVFCAGAIAGASAKTLTAPLDRWKLLLQVKSVQNPNAVQAVGKVNLVESFVQIGKEEGIWGYWKGNLPQVLRIIPYSAVQLFAYETYKNLFKGDNKELSVPARLAAGACAGMTSTFITYPLDVLRLRLAVEPGAKQMTVVAMKILREEGAMAFYKGLGPSLISIAPYIALNFCAFDLVKKSIPEEYRKTPQASLITALCATTFATVMCYPLDTVRRQMQMRNSPFNTVFEAVPGIIKRDGVLGLYRGFIANALKNLPNSSIRLTTYDALKQVMANGKVEYQTLLDEERRKREAAPAALPAKQPQAA